MSYLQLAEGNPYNRLAEGNPLANYIFIPAGMLGMQSDTYVRQDFFDSLSDSDYKAVITKLAPYQNTGLSVLPIAAASAGLKVVGNLIKKRQERVAAGTAKPLFKQGGKIAGLIGKLKAAKAASTSDQNADLKTTQPFDVQTSGTIGGVDFTAGAGSAEPKESFFTKYKTPLLIGGGLVLAGSLVIALRKKKR